MDAPGVQGRMLRGFGTPRGRADPTASSGRCLSQVEAGGDKLGTDPPAPGLAPVLIWEGLTLLLFGPLLSISAVTEPAWEGVQVLPSQTHICTRTAAAQSPGCCFTCFSEEDEGVSLPGKAVVAPAALTWPGKMLRIPLSIPSKARGAQSPQSSYSSPSDVWINKQRKLSWHYPSTPPFHPAPASSAVASLPVRFSRGISLPAEEPICLGAD